MSCNIPLNSKGNTHLFLRPNGQTTWTRADRVIGANNLTVSTTSASIKGEDIDEAAFTLSVGGSVDISINFEYRFLLDAVSDVVLYGAQTFREPLGVLLVFGDYPDATATANRYYAGSCFVTGLDLDSASNSFIKHTVALVPACGLTSGANLTTVDPTDAIAPTVTLASNTLTVTSDQTITLTATASDNVGVFKVEFWEGAVLLGTDFSTAFDWGVPLTSADNGTKSYTAKAYDLAGNVTTSNPVTVTVNIVASLYPAGMIYGLNMINVVEGEFIPLPEAENQTPANILGGTAQTWGMGELRATWNFGDPNLLAANGSEGLTYYVAERRGDPPGGWDHTMLILTDITGANYTWAQSAIHFRYEHSFATYSWALGRGGDAPAFNAPSAQIRNPWPHPSITHGNDARVVLRVGPTFGGAPSAADLGVKATSAGGTYDQATPTITNPNPATLTPTRNILGIGTTADNLADGNGGPGNVYAGRTGSRFYYLLIFRGEHDLATETAVIAQMRAELATRGVVLP